jgi:uncharacterized protein (UPF0335 family)
MPSQHAIACLERLEQDLTTCTNALTTEYGDAVRATLLAKLLGAVVQLEELRDHFLDAPERARLEELRAIIDSIEVTPEDASALGNRFSDIVEHYRNSVRAFFDPANESQADDLA